MNPHQISEKRILLSEEYSRHSTTLASLLGEQAKWFTSNREGYKSDTATQRAFETTEDGILMNQLKLRLKAIEKQLSAYNTALRLAENEAKGLY